MTGRVLIVAGSDSGGGAGIQADLKTVQALGGYAGTALTALTAQNTLGVHGLMAVPPDFVRSQMAAVLGDIGADAVKTGMLHDAGIIAAVAEVLAAYPAIPLVVDPVMVSTSGTALLDAAGTEALVARLLPRAALLTPNLPEAERLLGRAIPDADAMAEAAIDLLALGPKAVLLKGGHLRGDRLQDVLADGQGSHRFEATRIAGRHTHGTGCTLASAIATGLAQGRPLVEAVARARAYVRAAIAASPELGQGRGPLGHGVTVGPF